MTPPIRARALASLAALLVAGLAVTGCGSGGPKRTAVNFAADRPLSVEELRHAAEQLRHRAELLGLKAPRVSTEGGTLSLSAAGPIADRIEALTHQLVVEFRPVLAAGLPDSPTPSGTVPPQLLSQYQALNCSTPARPADPATGTVACSTASPQQPATKLVLGPAALKGADIAASTAGFENQWQINLTFTPAGATAFTSLTTQLSGQPDPANQLAIVIDGAVVSHPYISQPITGGQAVISGSFTRAEAETLAAQLATTDLPAGLHPTA
ncbi:hypothetical protein ACFV1L_28750 [Kitasatospora sp. NPDC059646]|uniref:SecDF P1 head subdomain-containing protein n=1 Tax=Kitasatospora sp. NPDC059646 TaxID=3346893 RepID=UPI003693D16F